MNAKQEKTLAAPKIVEDAHQSTDLVLSRNYLVEQASLIQDVMKHVMKQTVHYGIIQGCKHPSLFKPGAEKILSTFRIAVEPEVTNLSTEDEVRYIVKVRAVHQVTGRYLGHGIGECSSSEEKYRWREAVCQEEWDSFPADLRRIKYRRKKGGGHFTINQVRTVPADLANTVLKMATKRAKVDCALSITAASDLFTQDVEDLPDEIREEISNGPRPRQTNGNGGSQEMTEWHQKLGAIIVEICGSNASLGPKVLEIATRYKDAKGKSSLKYVKETQAKYLVEDYEKNSAGSKIIKALDEITEGGAS